MPNPLIFFFTIGLLSETVVAYIKLSKNFFNFLKLALNWYVANQKWYEYSFFFQFVSWRRLIKLFGRIRLLLDPILKNQKLLGISQTKLYLEHCDQLFFITIEILYGTLEALCDGVININWKKWKKILP
jgi:hypothetical protein